MSIEQDRADFASVTLSDKQICELADQTIIAAIVDLADDTVGLSERLQEHLGEATEAEYDAHIARLRKEIRDRFCLD